jgi:hypothetical protein
MSGGPPSMFTPPSPLLSWIRHLRLIFKIPFALGVIAPSSDQPVWGHLLCVTQAGFIRTQQGDVFMEGCFEPWCVRVGRSPFPPLGSAHLPPHTPAWTPHSCWCREAESRRTVVGLGEQVGSLQVKTLSYSGLVRSTPPR